MAQSAKRVWEVCEPHPDVFSRDPDPSLFVISLHHVMQGSEDQDYTDPERFFTRTYMTRALSDLLERVVGRLAGLERGAPVLRLETPFGGGKTHTMTALYHIARSPELLSDHESLRPILERLNLRTLPPDIRVAVLDGRGLDVRERRTEDGLTVRTLWGELAVQLGGRPAYEMLSGADETRTAPGGARLTELLHRFRPALILMDEVLEYLLKARAVKVGDSNLTEQTGAFLGELTAAVSAVPQCVLVLALPASSWRWPRRTGRLPNGSSSTPKRSWDGWNWWRRPWPRTRSSASCGGASSAPSAANGTTAGPWTPCGTTTTSTPASSPTGCAPPTTRSGC
jgi:predicted AAA+ superfamily ATPase